MNAEPVLNQFDQYLVEGAYTDLDRLVALHRFGRNLQLSGSARSRSAQSGEWQTRSRGRGIDFEEVRLYQPGDDIRSIDWRVTARSQVPHTKVFREERERPVMLVADLRSTMFFGSQHCFKSVLCASLLSALAWAALNKRDRIGALVFGDNDHREIRPKSSKHAVLELIRQMHRFANQLTTPCPERAPASLSSRLETLTRLCRPGTAIYIASDFHDFDDDCQRRLYQLRRHNDVTLFRIEDPLERELPKGQGFWLTDGLRRLASDQVVTDQHQQQIEQLQHFCQGTKVGLHSLSTSEPLMHRLYAEYGSQARMTSHTESGDKI